MDVSEIFIKQCDCPEIQEQKEEFIDGDWFAYYEAKCGGGKGDLVIGVIGATYYSFNRKEVEKTGSAFKSKWLAFSIVGFDEGDCELGWEYKLIWLPRQDQIQEMAGTNNEEPFCDWLSRLEKFTHIAQPWDIPIDKSGLKTIGWFETWEQLWLAFYIYEKHKKGWDGNKWIK